MNTYILTHQNMNGEVELGYDSSGRLIKWHLKAELNEASYQKLLSRIPTDVKNVNAYKNKGFTVKHLPPDLSFERFYKLYGNKNGKLGAEKAWNRLSQAKKMRAIERIDAYRSYTVKERIKMQYPATYINQETFDDEGY